MSARRTMLFPLNRGRLLVIAFALAFAGLGNAQSIPVRLGDIDADGQPTVLDLVRLINHVNGTVPLSSPRLPYGDVNEDGAINQADVDLVADAILGVTPLPNPFAPPLISAPIASTNGSNLFLSGLARPHRTIVINGGLATTTTSSDANGNFSVNVILQPNRLNILYVTATNSAFTAGTPQILRVIQDSQPPSLFIDFPAHGTELISSNVVVAGRVGDMLSGFMGLAVTVTNLSSHESQPATGGGDANVVVGIGNNGTFERGEVPLLVGTNVLVATARDIHGNAVRKTNIVRRVVPVGLRMVSVSGDMQTTNIQRRLAQPIVVRIEGENGAPFSNKVVTFTATRSDGRLLPVDTNFLAADVSLRTDSTTNGVMSLPIFTDADGYARAWWTLGGDAGCGNNRVCATSRDIEGAAYFCASARPAPVRQINVGTGHNQRVEAGGPALEPLRAWVSDSCNGIEGIPVTFRVIEGGGRLLSSPGSQGEGGTNHLTILSTRTGHAEARFILDPDAGDNVIEATFPGNSGRAATFVLYGLARDPARPTTFRGLVLDNSSQPIGGARCVLQVGDLTLPATFTTVNGQFAFTNIPAGPAHLHVDGLTATSLGTNAILTGSFPALTYSMTVVPNAGNSLPMPVLLPRLDPANARVYYGTNDLVLTCEGMAGLKMFVKAGSMRRPDGSVPTPQDPAIIALNQVHYDDVPMPMPDGAAPPFAWTLQPGGAHFDPPITIEYPNMSALPAGAIAYFLSFNHDTERFEIIASGHVQADGATIVTDPGVGLSIAGWGCNCPPYAVTGAVDTCEEEPEAALRAAGGAGGSSGSTFTDRPIGPKAKPANDLRCGFTDYSHSHKAGCVCDPENGGKKTLAVARVTLTVTDKWFWSAITDTNDIAFVTDHENHHVTVLKEFFDLMAAEADALNGRRFPTAKACKEATKAFKTSYATNFAAMTKRHETEVDNEAHTLMCSNLLEKYAPPAPQPLAAAPLTQLLPDLQATDLTEEWTLTVNGQSVVSELPTSFSIGNVSAPDQFGPGGPGTAPDFLGDDLLRLTGVRTRGGVPQYVASGFFQIQQGSTTVLGELTITDTPPRSPGSIRAVPDQATLTQTGQVTTVRVTATFPDGSTEERTTRTSGTTYRISNPAVATISENGVVSAQASGTVFVTAVNEGSTAVAQLNVSFGDPLTVVEGFLQQEDGTPAVGVVVSVSGLATGVTGADGRFSIVGVPTGFGVLTVAAQIVEGSVRLIGVARQVIPVPGGATDAGIIVLSAPTASKIPVVAGLFHSVALKTNGTLWAWGRNNQGQLGDGTITDRLSPVPVGAASDWACVAAGSSHTVAVKRDGALWTWGYNFSGQLGDGTTVRRTSPVRLGAENDWLLVAAGSAFTIAMKIDGSLWAWGHNAYGQLGDGTTANKLVPTRIGTGSDWMGVAAGNFHTLALKADGSLWGWGRNSSGQLGDANPLNKLSPARLGSDSDWAALDAGDFYSTALKADGSLWSWGQNNLGQLGDGTIVNKLSPVRLGLDNDWATISAGNAHVAGLKLDGSLWAWGLNDQGQFGDGSLGQKLSPTRIGSESDWVSLAAGDRHTLGLKLDGSLRSWGDNNFGQLGDGTREQGQLLSPVAVGTDSDWASVAAGLLCSIALRTDGSLWAWGENSFGQLGDGGQADKLSPVRIGADTDWAFVTAGNAHTVASKTDGSLWAWGENSFGRLGDGTTVDRLSPVRIGAANDWVAASAGDIHTAGLKSGGSLWTWGDNTYGQLGGGTTTDQLTPTQVGPDTNWMAIAAGHSHMVALKFDRSLWAWGRNHQGQVGDGTIVNKLSPVRIGLDNDWATIAAGDLHTVALKTDGSLWAWGDNSQGAGQLGDGTTVDKLSPTRIGLANDWQSIAVGRFHTVGLKSDGSLWAWGDNGSGQLGDGSQADKLSPVRIGAAHDWTHFTAGRSHTLALKSSGLLWAWGSNNQGQLGIWAIAQVAGGSDWGQP